MVAFEGKCASAGQRLAAATLAALLLLWAPSAPAQTGAGSPLPDPAPRLDPPAAGEVPGPLGAPGGTEIWGGFPDAPVDPVVGPPPAPGFGLDPTGRAWFAWGDDLQDRVGRTLDAALELGRPSLDAMARALLLEESLGAPLERARSAVRLAPDLPAARIAYGQALWREERDLFGALEQVRRAAPASARHLEASLWLRATASHAVALGCLGGGLLFLLVAGGSLIPVAARLLGALPGGLPTVSRAALVVSLLLIPAVLGEGVFGVALGFAALVFWCGTSWQRLSVGTALLVAMAGLHPLADRAGEELVALGSDPVAEAAFAVERTLPSPMQVDRLERAAPEDPLAERALAIHAKRSGELEDADLRFTALIEASASPSSSLLNNAANVRLALDRIEEAIQLYEAAARLDHSVVVRFNLSQAYGRAIELERQELALAEAQVIDAAAVAALTELYARLPRPLVADLPLEAEVVRVRLGDPAAARQAAAALRHRFAPGWLGHTPLHGAAGIGLALLLGSGFAVALHRVTRSGEGSGDLYAGIARLLTGREAADPFLRMVRLSALRERQARIDRAKFLLSLTVPGAAGVLSQRPLLGLLASLLFALGLSSWSARGGVVADPLALGGGGSLLFGAAALGFAAIYAAVVALTIALRERS